MFLEDEGLPSSIIWWGTPATFASTTKPVGQGGVLGMPRVDGYADGTDIIQGVRTYDANAGIWTTPDAYAGDVDDPASQKSYMWNGNNPEAYGDPSGYYQINPNELPGCHTLICGGYAETSSNIDLIGLRNVERNFAHAAQAAANDVRKHLQSLPANSQQISMFRNLLKDLQPGQGNWEISFGSTPGSYAVTDVRGTGADSDGLATNITSSGSTFDIAGLNSESLRANEATVVTEGAKFDMATGRAGPALYEEMLAYYREAGLEGLGPGQNGRSYFDRYTAQMSNANYNAPLNLQLDACAWKC